MAKKDKQVKKDKAKAVGAAIEAQGVDMAHKIWLAGVGAYGKAYDMAAEGVGKFGGSTSVVFEDLVKRGEEIESDMRARLASNTALTKVSSQVAKVGEQVAKLRAKVRERTDDVTETVTKFQEEQRERLEARMERMRDALGLKAFTGKARKAEKLHNKLDELEEQVAELRANSEGVDEKVKARVERLSAEIAAVAEDAPKKAKKSKKAKKAKKTKAVVEAVEVELPMTDENGRLKAPIGEADDLKTIKGVGAVLERKLNDAGIFHFWQIAALTAEQIEVLETDMSFPGRIGRDNWTAQAKTFAEQVSA